MRALPGKQAIFADARRSQRFRAFLWWLRTKLSTEEVESFESAFKSST
jgi:hypothetical protein